MPDRILTTHVGSLVRPPEIVRFAEAMEAGTPVDPASIEATVAAAVKAVVARQAAAGVDIVSVGALTHSVRSLDIGLDVDIAPLD